MAVSFILWYPCLSTYAISLYRVDPAFLLKSPKNRLNTYESHSAQIYSVKKSALLNCSESDTFLVNYTLLLIYPSVALFLGLIIHGLPNTIE